MTKVLAKGATEERHDFGWGLSVVNDIVRQCVFVGVPSEVLTE